MSAKQQDYTIADYMVGQRKVKQTFFTQINKIIDRHPIRAIIEKLFSDDFWR